MKPYATREDALAWFRQQPDDLQAWIKQLASEGQARAVAEAYRTAAKIATWKPNDESGYIAELLDWHGEAIAADLLERARFYEPIR